MSIPFVPRVVTTRDKIRTRSFTRLQCDACCQDCDALVRVVTADWYDFVICESCLRAALDALEKAKGESK